MTPRQKKIVPLINQALALLNKEAQNLINRTTLNPKLLQVVGRDPTQGAELPIKLKAVYYLEDTETCCYIDFDVDFADFKDDKLQKKVEGVFSKLLTIYNMQVALKTFDGGVLPPITNNPLDLKWKA